MSMMLFGFVFMFLLGVGAGILIGYWKGTDGAFVGHVMSFESGGKYWVRSNGVIDITPCEEPPHGFKG